MNQTSNAGEYRPFLAAFAAAILIGAVNLHTDEPQPAAALILLSAFALTMWRPKVWWAWASVAALSVPLSYVIAGAFHFYAVDPPSNVWVTLVAFIPAVVAAGLGLGIRSLQRPLSDR